MGPYKAPGPDGFGACFYQYHWPSVGTSITKVILSYLNGSPSVANINLTYLTIIDKKQQALTVNDY